MERLVENLPNVEAVRWHKVDGLPFPSAISPIGVSPPDVGEASISRPIYVAILGIDQVMFCVACIHSPARKSIFLDALTSLKPHQSSKFPHFFRLLR